MCIGWYSCGLCDLIGQICHWKVREHFWRRKNADLLALSPSPAIIWSFLSKAHLTHSHTITPFDTPGKQAFWKHCGKRRNCSFGYFLPFSSNLKLTSANPFRLEESKNLSSGKGLIDLIDIKGEVYHKPHKWYKIKEEKQGCSLVISLLHMFCFFWESNKYPNLD